jgi:class 3 adenylate cyclase/tetratricopeptide (TPR) repeat protein
VEATVDVATWLKNLGLGQYEAAFHNNAIDEEVLPKLTADDLKDIGVAIVGHRRKMLSAIAELSALSAAPTQVGPAAEPAPAAAFAERRHLTVMFCDLVGSTAISARLDPEDMGEVIRAYHDACSGAIARYDGLVAKFMGDGVLAYFGFPRAHEDDAERAVRAGLDISAVVAKLETAAKDRLQVRIGVATGIVVVGDLVGQGSAQEQAVVGDTPNLAARLQNLAEPGSLVIAESTKRLLGGTFELKPLGAQTLKGFDAPVSAWAVLREAEIVSRFEASQPEGLTPFVGREHEVALLLDRWRGAREGEGQVVLLSGEAGIGKSRILAALREEIGAERHVTVRYQCSPHHVNDAFYPIANHIWHAAGFLSGEPAAARLDKLEAMIARSAVQAKEAAPLLASLLSIPLGERYTPLEMAPAEQKERTIAALIGLFEGLTRDTPVLALFEDAHWMDPTSVDVFGRLTDQLPSWRALLVITFRPEFAAPWVGRTHVTALSLTRFGRRQALAMVDRVAGGKALPSDVLEQIVAKTDGVPLFMEELTKTVLESGQLREEGGAYVLASALTPIAIPSTLQDSLMARLDRLAPVRDIAQIGAAIGREFSFRLLEAVSPMKGLALRDALDQLMASELIYGRGAPPETTYIFKHALVQDTAYASLLRSRRQRIHADIARALEERFADQLEASPAIIAHHYTEAGLAEPAAHNWLAAAESALSRSAYAEAGRYVDAGLALMPRLTDAGSSQSLELGLQVARMNALVPLRGFTGVETVLALTEAKRLLDSGIGTDLQRFSVFYALWASNLFASKMEPALTLAIQFMEVAERSDDTVYRLIGYRLIGTMQAYMGRILQALENFERAEEYRDPHRPRIFTYRFGVDPDLGVLSAKLLPLTLLGRHDQTAQVREQMLAAVSNDKHAATVAVCSFFAQWSELLNADFEACERHSAELIAFCADKKVEQWRLLAAICHALACATRRPTTENIAAVHAAMSAKNRIGIRMFDSVFLTYLAAALLSAGDVANAEVTLNEALAFIEDSRIQFWAAELHRLDGRIALKRSEPDLARAEACFVRAVDIARSQEALLLELRAATDLARLWGDTGSGRDPRPLLGPILAAIEGGETTRDVRDARALLAEIV